MYSLYVDLVGGHKISKGELLLQNKQNEVCMNECPSHFAFLSVHCIVYPYLEWTVLKGIVPFLFIYIIRHKKNIKEWGAVANFKF